MRATEIDLEFVPLPAPATSTIEAGGEALVVDEARSRLYLLNPTATLLWACFDGGGSLGEIIDDLTEATAAPRPVVAADVLDLVVRLGREGLLVGVDFEPGPDSTAEVLGSGRPLVDTDPRFVFEAGST